MENLKTDLVIDSDTHVEEHPAVWEYMSEEFKARKPVTVKIDTIPDRPKRDVHWFIDGEIMPRRMGHGHTCHGSPVLSTFALEKDASIEEQAIMTAEARLQAMDRGGVDVHVVYPTVFLQNLTKDLQYELALMRSYNDYIAERAAESGGRLRWIATVPIRDVPAAVEEMKRAHSLGASGVMLLGTAGDTFLHERQFDPFWKVAEHLQIPICCHLGWGHDSLMRSCDSPAAGVCIGVDFCLVMGLFSFVGGGIYDRFPALKVALVEGGIDWFPVAFKRMTAWKGTAAAHPWPALKDPEYYLQECPIYFGAGGDEDNLPDLLKTLGPDRLLGGQDFPHAHEEDGGMSHSFIDLRRRTDVSDTAKKGILCNNAMEFYGIKKETVESYQKKQEKLELA
ncbi:amidohydrolase family protein [Aestuariispira ectoiniformans]|uniref:amidohydrolase family protein n=1 Tax=Aestuariispira ectoiniformans TaxID=2775080 RepID=UPI00223B3CDC|nr:amidohydrolase family protein [Aestuariispira ectoiniformans]